MLGTFKEHPRFFILLAEHVECLLCVVPNLRVLKVLASCPALYLCVLRLLHVVSVLNLRLNLAVREGPFAPFPILL